MSNLRRKSDKTKKTKWMADIQLWIAEGESTRSIVEKLVADGVSSISTAEKYLRATRERWAQLQDMRTMEVRAERVEVMKRQIQRINELEKIPALKKERMIFWINKEINKITGAYAPIMISSVDKNGDDRPTELKVTFENYGEK